MKEVKQWHPEFNNNHTNVYVEERSGRPTIQTGKSVTHIECKSCHIVTQIHQRQQNSSKPNLHITASFGQKGVHLVDFMGPRTITAEVYCESLSKTDHILLPIQFTRFINSYGNFLITYRTARTSYLMFTMSFTSQEVVFIRQ